MDLIKSMMHRNLRKLDRFRWMDDSVLSECTKLIQFDLNETCLGIYDNTLESVSDSIVLTDQSVYQIVDNVVQLKFRYDEVIDLKGPEKKTEIDSEIEEKNMNIYITTPSGIHTLTLKGYHGRLLDSFSVLTFLLNVCGSSKN